MGIELRASVVNPNDIATKQYVDTAIDSYPLPAGYRLDASVNAGAPSSFVIPAASTILFHPFKVTDSFRASEVYMVVTTSNANARCVLALYDSNTNGTPKDLIWFTNTLSIPSVASVIVTTALFKTAPSTYQLRNINSMVFEAKTYWLGFQTLVTGGTIRGIGTGSLLSLGLPTAGNPSAYATYSFKTAVTTFPDLNPFDTGGYVLTAGSVPSIRFTTTTI